VRELGRVQLASYAIELSVAGTEREPRAEVLNHVGLSCWGTVAVRRFSIDRRGVRAASLLDDDACAHGEGSCARMGDLEGGAHGSAYARSAGPEGSVLAGPVLLVRPGEHTTPTNLRLEAEASLSVAHNGALTFALSEGCALPARGVCARRACAGRSMRTRTLVYVDPRGRPLRRDPRRRDAALLAPQRLGAAAVTTRAGLRLVGSPSMSALDSKDDLSVLGPLAPLAGVWEGGKAARTSRRPTIAAPRRTPTASG
jgi:hypothetical protein